MCRISYFIFGEEISKNIVSHKVSCLLNSHGLSRESEERFFWESIVILRFIEVVCDIKCSDIVVTVLKINESYRFIIVQNEHIVSKKIIMAELNLISIIVCREEGEHEILFRSREPHSFHFFNESQLALSEKSSLIDFILHRCKHTLISVDVSK